MRYNTPLNFYAEQAGIPEEKDPSWAAIMQNAGFTQTRSGLAETFGLPEDANWQQIAAAHYGPIGRNAA